MCFRYLQFMSDWVNMHEKSINEERPNKIMKPSNKDAYARLMILKAIVSHATTNTSLMFPEIFLKWSEKEKNEFELENKNQSEFTINDLKEKGLWKYVSPKESLFLNSYAMNMDKQQHVNAIWRKECISMLMWALSLRETWPNIDQETTPEQVKEIQIQKIGLFFKSPDLRPQEEISRKRAIIEGWHWRTRTRGLIEENRPFPVDEQMKKAGFNSYDDIVRFSAKNHLRDGDIPGIIDEDFVFLGKAFRSLTSEEFQFATSIIMERHFALNWLCGMAPSNRWDETPTDT